jgi:hypothetical protein
MNLLFMSFHTLRLINISWISTVDPEEVINRVSLKASESAEDGSSTSTTRNRDSCVATNVVVLPGPLRCGHYISISIINWI